MAREPEVERERQQHQQQHKLRAIECNRREDERAMVKLRQPGRKGKK